MREGQMGETNSIGHLPFLIFHFLDPGSFKANSQFAIAGSEFANEKWQNGK
jgi:hypothetical protein